MGSYQKSNRFRCLKKKLEELTTLCDVKALLVCFKDDNDDISPYSWPEDQTTCLSLIERYKTYNRKNKRKREVVVEGNNNPSSIPASSMKKMKTNTHTDCSEGLGYDQLKGYKCLIDEKLRKVDEKIMLLKHKQVLKNQEIKKVEEHHGVVSDEYILSSSGKNQKVEHHGVVSDEYILSSGTLESIVLECRYLVRRTKPSKPDHEAVVDFSGLGFVGDDGISDYINNIYFDENKNKDKKDKEGGLWLHELQGASLDNGGGELGIGSIVSVGGDKAKVMEKEDGFSSLGFVGGGDHDDIDIEDYINMIDFDVSSQDHNCSLLNADGTSLNELPDVVAVDNGGFSACL